MKLRQRVTVFSDKYPFLGPIVWILSLQFFIVQFVVASAWNPPYDWANNLISDLGNIACGQYAGRYVCSPDHAIMNASFVMLGITMAVGSVLIYQEFEKTRLSFAGFLCMGLAGIGTALVGLYPENTVTILHALGALLALGIGNVGLILLAFGIRQARRVFRVYTFASGLVSLVAICFFWLEKDFGLGRGTIERIASHPQTIWLIMLGIYMTTVRTRVIMRRRRA